MMPSGLRRFTGRIEGYSDERCSQNGIWMYYRPGWKSGNDPLGEQHQDVGDTVAQMVSYARNAVVCNCQECEALGKTSEDR